MEAHVAGFCRDEANSDALAAAYIDAARTRSWTRGVVHEHEAAAHEHIEVGGEPLLNAKRGFLARMS